MINKITNSFIGGFFRRLGSIFAFIIILCILGYFFKDFDNKDFINNLLGFQVVKADEIVGRYSSNFSANGSKLNYDGGSDTYLASFTDQSYGRQTRYISSNFSVPSNSYYMYIKLYHHIRLDSADNVDLEYNSNTITGNYFDTSKTILTLTIRNNSAWSNCENVSSSSQVTYMNNRPYNTGYDTFKCPVSVGTTSITDFTISYYSNIQAIAYIGINPNFQFLTSSGNSIVSEQQATTQAINNLNNTQQQTNNKIDETNNKLQETNDTLNSTDTTEAESEAEDLFTNFETSDYGLSGIITAPLNLIESLVSKNCTPLKLPLPFVDEDLTLPCLSSIYRDNFNIFLVLYQTIISALIGYKICVEVFFMVKGFKDPGEDKIEVLDL